MSHSEDNSVNSTYVIAGSIIIAGIIIAAAVMYSNGGANGGQANVRETLTNEPEAPTGVNLAQVSASDHILGDPNAAVKLVEYSDLDCPFCTRFHQTIISDIKADYIDSGKVAWVYRHFPLDMHPDARAKAEAAECVAEIGGNEGFWKFADAVFADDETLAELPGIVSKMGINVKAFNACVDESRYADKVSSQQQDGINAGAQGTPYAVVIAKDGEKLVIPGALPGAQIKSILDQALG